MNHKKKFSFVLKVESFAQHSYKSNKDASHTSVVRLLMQKWHTTIHQVSNIQVIDILFHSFFREKYVSYCINTQIQVLLRCVYYIFFHIIKKPYHMTSVGFGVEDWTSQGPSRKLMIPKHSMDYACIVLLATIWFQYKTGFYLEKNGK